MFCPEIFPSFTVKKSFPQATQRRLARRRVVNGSLGSLCRAILLCLTRLHAHRLRWMEGHGRDGFLGPKKPPGIQKPVEVGRLSHYYFTWVFALSRISEPSTVSWGLSSIWKVYSPSYPIDFRPFTRVTSKTHLPEEYECNSLKGIPPYPNQQLKIRWLSWLFRIRYRRILWCLIGGVIWA